MFQRIFKNLFSLFTLFAIALVYSMVHFIGNKPQLSGLTFLLYLIIFLTGIGFIRATLLRYFNDSTVAITILGLAFGTNLYCMVSLDYQLQPILLFSLYAIVVFLTASWHDHHKQVWSVLLAVGLALIILLQPTGFISLLIPVLWGVYDKASWKSKILLIKNDYRQFDVFISCLAVLVLPPVLFWNISPGEIPFLSFKLPGLFYSFSSWFWNDLFSFDHGWLIYSPLMIFAFIGFYFFEEMNRPLFYPVYLFCILDLFLETSWSLLGTTPVFGQVAFIPAYALLVLPMASLFSVIHKGRRFQGIALCLVTAIFIFMNIFQTWQYNQGIILQSGMTADKYGQVFGRTNVTETEKMQIAGIEHYASLFLKDESRFRKTTLAFYDFEEPNLPYKSKLERDYVKSGKMAFTMDGTARFSPGLEMQYNDFKKKQWVGLRYTASVFATSPEALSEANLVITSVHEGTNYRYERLNFDDLKLKPGIWNTVSLDYLIPEEPDPRDHLFAYIWYTGNSRIFVDDIKCEAFELKK
jgi:hypothetical protein